MLIIHIVIQLKLTSSVSHVFARVAQQQEAVNMWTQHNYMNKRARKHERGCFSAYNDAPNRVLRS